MSKALPVYTLAFPESRIASHAYRAGVFDTLLTRLDGCSPMPFPYQLGSAEADAYKAGKDEGELLAEDALYEAEFARSVTPEMAIRAEQATARHRASARAAREQIRLQATASTPGQRDAELHRLLEAHRAGVTNQSTAAMPPAPLAFLPDDQASDSTTPAGVSQ